MDRYQQSIQKAKANKDKNLDKLVQLSFDKLKELQNYYYDWYKSAEKADYTESAHVNYLHYATICEAIDIKKGNEEQAWDYLS